jgi:type IV secretory pathway TrbD component
MARVTPFYRALIEPRLTLGVDNTLFAAVALGTVFLFMAFRSWWPPVGGVVALIVFRSIFKADPLYLRIYFKYCAEGDHYEPWITPRTRAGRRVGRGRGVLC